MKKTEQKVPLDGPTSYQSKVPGELDARWSGWAAGMTLAVESGGDGLPVTTMAGTVDQAALQSVLRRLYSLGLPLISMTCIECGQDRRQTEFLTIQDDPFKRLAVYSLCQYIIGEQSRSSIRFQLWKLGSVMVAQGAAYCRQGLDRQGHESGI